MGRLKRFLPHIKVFTWFCMHLLSGRQKKNRKAMGVHVSVYGGGCSPKDGTENEGKGKLNSTVVLSVIIFFSINALRN